MRQEREKERLRTLFKVHDDICSTFDWNNADTYSGQQILGMSFSEKRREDNFFVINHSFHFVFLCIFLCGIQKLSL